MHSLKFGTTKNILAVIGTLFLLGFLIDNFIGIKNSLYISKSDGSYLKKKSLVFWASPEYYFEFVLDAKYEDNSYSKFLGLNNDHAIENENNWLYVMGSIHGVLSKKALFSPTPNMNVRFPIAHSNEQLIYDFLSEMEHRNPRFKNDLMYYFAELPKSSNDEFIVKMNLEFEKWLAFNHADNSEK